MADDRKRDAPALRLPERESGVLPTGMTRRRFLGGGMMAALGAPFVLAGPGAAARSPGSAVRWPDREKEPIVNPEVIPNVAVALMDSYGTVFDIGSTLISALRGIVPYPKEFAHNWFDQQAKWTLTLGGLGTHAYFDWWELTHRTGRWMLEEHNVQVTDEQWEKMLQAWYSPQPYRDADVFVNRLHEAGVPNAILSNGAPRMLHAASDQAGWLPELETIISVDQSHTYKPSPQVYLLAHDVFRVPAQGDLLFISAHQWDIAGAAAAGLRTVYLNRDNQPMWRIGYDADYVVNDMKPLAEAIIRGFDEDFVATPRVQNPEQWKKRF